MSQTQRAHKLCVSYKKGGNQQTFKIKIKQAPKLETKAGLVHDNNSHSTGSSRLTSNFYNPLELLYLSKQVIGYIKKG